MGAVPVLPVDMGSLRSATLEVLALNITIKPQRSVSAARLPRMIWPIFRSSALSRRLFSAHARRSLLRFVSLSWSLVIPAPVGPDLEQRENELTFRLLMQELDQAGNYISLSQWELSYLSLSQVALTASNCKWSAQRYENSFSDSCLFVIRSRRLRSNPRLQSVSWLRRPSSQSFFCKPRMGTQRRSAYFRQPGPGGTSTN